MAGAVAMQVDGVDANDALEAVGQLQSGPRRTGGSAAGRRRRSRMRAPQTGSGYTSPRVGKGGQHRERGAR